MSKHNRERRQATGGGGPRRKVDIALVPESGTLVRVGVAISLGEDKTYIASDEARTIACKLDGEDDATAKALRATADAVDRMIQDPSRPGTLAPVKPRVTGPRALKDWVGRHRDLFRSAFREARRQGAPAGVVIWAMPATDSLDDAPLAFDPIDAATARARLASLGLDDPGPAEEGCFTIVASRREGRFRGTLTACLDCPGDAEKLPAAILAPDLPDPMSN